MGQVTTRVVIDGDGTAAVQSLEDVEQAAEHADTAVEQLSDRKVDVDTSPALDELSRLEREAQDVEDELDDIDRMKVEPDVDSSGVERAARDTEDLSGHAESTIGPLRGMTDELGEGAGTAGVYANALIDANEASRMMGARAGLTQQAMSVLSRAVLAGAGAILAGVKAWQIYQSDLAETRQRVEDLEEAQRALREGETDRAIERISEAMAGYFSTLRDAGIGTEDAVRLFSASREEAERLFNTLIDGSAISEKAYVDLVTVVNNGRQAWGDAGDNIAEADELTRELGDALLETGVAAVESGQAGERSMDRFKSSVDRADLAVRTLFDSIDQRQAWRALQDAGVQAAESIEAAVDDGTRTVEEQAAAVRQAEEDLDAYRETVALYAQDVLNLPSEMITEIDAKIQEGAIDEVESQLERLTRTREAVVDVVLGKTPSTYLPPVYPSPPSSGRPPEPASPAPSVPPTVFVRVNTAATWEPRRVIADVTRLERINGTSWL